MRKSRICSGCEFYKPPDKLGADTSGAFPIFMFQGTPALCMNEKLGRNKVNGAVMPQPCGAVRQKGVKIDGKKLCGPKAKWFLPKKAVDIDVASKLKVVE